MFSRAGILFVSNDLAISPRLCWSPRLFSTSVCLGARETSATIPNTSIKIFREIPALRQWRRKQLIDYRTVGLVPTMGALHNGHLSLIRMAAKENSSVVVSI